MIIRDAYQSLLSWRSSPTRKPLIIQGARQVGKTWLMKEFGRQEFATTAYFNFESTRDLHGIFRQDMDVKRILRALAILSPNKIEHGSTLILFDEIQECPEAVTCLKYFQENAPEFHIIAAGSLLGVAMHRGISFPVGKVDFLDLHPLGFHEFIRATGNDTLLDTLKSGDIKTIELFEQRFKELLKQYLFTGGMPEVVKALNDSGDFRKVRQLQENILRAYENDFSKHAPTSQLPRIRLVWQSIVGQLAKENSKFIYRVLRTGARAKDFELAIAWLTDAGLLRKVTRISKPGMPLSAYADWSDFKLYLNDVGLLCALADLGQEVLLKESELFTEFKGILTEQFVLQLLLLHGYETFYWNPENATSEVDFIIQKNNTLVPVEVKSAQNLKSRSLRVFFEKYHPLLCVRTSLAPYKEQDWMTNIPLYAFEQWLSGKLVKG